MGMQIKAAVVGDLKGDVSADDDAEAPTPRAARRGK